MTAKVSVDPYTKFSSKIHIAGDKVDGDKHTARLYLPLSLRESSHQSHSVWHHSSSIDILQVCKQNYLNSDFKHLQVASILSFTDL